MTGRGRGRTGAAALALLLVAGTATAGGGPRVSLGAPHRLPRELRWARDVRWWRGSSVLVAAGPAGTRVYDPGRGAGPLVAPGEASGGLWYHEHLGVSRRLTVLGAPAFELAWQDADGPTPWGRVRLDVIADLDVHRERLLVVGARRGSGGVWAPEGALAWLGTPGSQGLELHPVAFLPEGPGDRSLARCGFLETARCRFLDDGWFVVVPGVEDRVLLYRPDASLARIWEATALGVDSGCPATPQQARIARDLEAREAWLAGRRIVDEILPVGESAWLIVRRRERGVVRWHAAALGRDGSVERFELPLTSRSRCSHLRGDVRGDQVVLLVSESAPAGQDAPESPPVLLLGTVR